MNDVESNLTRQEVCQETAKIHWKELQRFFAGGLAFAVAADLDLVDVAYQCSLDNKIKVQEWIREHKLAKVTDKQSIEWFETDAEVWAVVVNPWVLVQGISTG